MGVLGRGRGGVNPSPEDLGEGGSSNFKVGGFKRSAQRAGGLGVSGVLGGSGFPGLAATLGSLAPSSAFGGPGTPKAEKKGMQFCVGLSPPQTG